jgi:hypothetical protein
MGVLQSRGGLEADPYRLFGSEQGAGVEDLAQAAPGQVLENQIGLVAFAAPVVDLENVGMIEAGNGLGFGLESFEAVTSR